MEVAVSYHSGKKICIIKTKGIIKTVSDARLIFDHVTPIIEKEEISRFLFDHRESKIEATITETYITGAEPEAWGWKRNFKAATLNKKIPEVDKFLEIVTSNRGIRFKSFDDFDTAVKWLLES